MSSHKDTIEYNDTDEASERSNTKDIRLDEDSNSVIHRANLYSVEKDTENTENTEDTKDTKDTEDTRQSTTRSCRICFDDENPDTFVEPCHCKGSMQFVHIKCLEKWISTSGIKICTICKYKYQRKVNYTPSLLKHFDNETAKHRATLCLFLVIFVLMCASLSRLLSLFQKYPSIQFIFPHRLGYITFHQLLRTAPITMIEFTSLCIFGVLCLVYYFSSLVEHYTHINLRTYIPIHDVSPYEYTHPFVATHVLYNTLFTSTKRLIDRVLEHSKQTSFENVTKKIDLEKSTL